MNFRYTISLIILLQSTICSASHNYGAEITYRHISGFTYEATIVTYTNASALADRCELKLDWGDGTLDILYRVNGQSTFCGPPTRDGELIAGGEIRFSIYSGVHTYPGAGTFVISMLDPNRNDGIINMFDSFNTPLYVESILSINDTLCVNNSIEFEEIPIIYAQSGTLISHNVTVSDPDGDSLSFEFIDCLAGQGQSVPGYFIPNNFSWSALTGEFWWQVPSVIGPNEDEYNFAIRITEWRKGVSISRITRDFQIRVTDQVSAVYRFDTIGTWNSNLVYSIYPGDTASSSLSYFDSLSPWTNLLAYGEVFNLTSPASFSTTNFVNSIKGVFQWVPDSSAARNHPYIITFRGTSGSTPPIQNDLTIRVFVIGQKQYCSLTALAITEHDKNQGSILIAPNPFTAYTKISLSGVDRIQEFRMFDLMGKEVIKIDNIEKSEFTLYRGQLSNGLYLYKINSKNKLLSTGKLVIN